MSDDFFEEILAHKRNIVEEKKDYLTSIKTNISSTGHTRYRIFKQAISKPGKICFIAEMKKASPSKGMLRQDYHVEALAQTYLKAQVDAISVLTEEKYFLGKPPDLKKVSDAVSIPLLMKDFIIDELQVYEAAYSGASAILLIVAALNDEQMRHLLKVAADVDLDCLVEIHNEQELQRALNCGAEIIGINNRDLKTFEVDLKTCESLIPIIPKDKVIVAESGIQSHQEIQTLQDLGASAVLIGETLMTAVNIEAKIRELMHGSG